MGDKHRRLRKDVQLRHHLADFHIGRDVFQAGRVDGAEGGKHIDIQIPDCIKQDGIVFGPVVEGGAQGGIQQRFAVVGGFPAAEGGPLANLNAGEHKTVIEALVIGHQFFLHHDQVEIPVSVKNLFYGHDPAAILFGVACRNTGGSLAQRMVCRAAFKTGGHRIAVVGRVTGVQHDIGHVQVVGGDGAGDAGKVVDDGVGLIVMEGIEDGVDVGSGLVQKEERHRSCHTAVVLFFLAVVVLVVFRHPGWDGDKLCAGGFNNVPKSLGRKISYPNALFDQLGDKGQSGVNMAKGPKGYKRNVHRRILSLKSLKAAMQAAHGVAHMAAGKKRIRETRVIVPLLPLPFLQQGTSYPGCGQRA